MKFGISYNGDIEQFELTLDMCCWQFPREVFFKMLEGFVFVGQEAIETPEEASIINKAREVVEKYASKRRAK